MLDIMRASALPVIDAEFAAAWTPERTANYLRKRAREAAARGGSVLLSPGMVEYAASLINGEEGR